MKDSGLTHPREVVGSGISFSTTLPFPETGLWELRTDPCPLDSHPP